MKKIIYGCEARGDKDKPYLIRWTLYSCSWFTLYFHKFVRSDAPDLHDHPWTFISFILWGGYYEETFKGLQFKGALAKYNETWKHWKRPGSILYRRASWTHRVELRDHKPAYTLVIRFKAVRNWGFVTPEGWKPWQKYYKDNGC